MRDDVGWTEPAPATPKHLKRLDLKVEHGVDAGAPRSLFGNLWLQRRRNTLLLGDSRRIHRCLLACLWCGTRRSTGSCDVLHRSLRLDSNLLQIGNVAGLFGTRLNRGK